MGRYGVPVGHWVWGLITFDLIEIDQWNFYTVFRMNTYYMPWNFKTLAHLQNVKIGLNFSYNFQPEMSFFRAQNFWYNKDNLVKFLVWIQDHNISVVLKFHNFTLILKMWPFAKIWPKFITFKVTRHLYGGPKYSTFFLFRLFSISYVCRN